MRHVQNTARSLMLVALALLAMAGAYASDERSSGTGRFELGAVVDVRRAHAEGLRVLAVTPGGAAERLGLRVDDRLQAINGQSLAGVADPGATLSRAVDASGGSLRLQVLRDGQVTRLSGTADTPVTATSQGCGFVTTLGATPRNSRNIHQAEITMIDGQSTPLFDVNRHQLGVGQHALVVAERIEPHRLSNVQNHQISLLKRREGVRGFYKALVVDIKPDTTYYIGARLLPDRLDNVSIRANAYWEPVVWQERAADCR